MWSHMWWSVRHYLCIPYRVVELYGCVEGLFCQLFFPHFVVSWLFSFILFCRHGQSLFRGMGIKCCFLSLSFTASPMGFFLCLSVFISSSNYNMYEATVLHCTFFVSGWSEVLPLQPGVGQIIATHATPTASSFSFLVSIFLVHSTSFFPNLFYTFSF